MRFKLPQDDQKYRWTNHVKDKMIYYRISEGLIKRIVRFPQRIEEGIAPNTIAVMQARESVSRTAGRLRKKREEIWVMYQKISQISKLKSQNYREREGLISQNSNLKKQNFKNNKIDLLDRPKLRIISAWRYPGKSPTGKAIPIPEDIRAEILNSLRFNK